MELTEKLRRATDALKELNHEIGRVEQLSGRFVADEKWFGHPDITDLHNQCARALQEFLRVSPQVMKRLPESAPEYLQGVPTDHLFSKAAFLHELNQK